MFFRGVAVETRNASRVWRTNFRATAKRSRKKSGLRKTRRPRRAEKPPNSDRGRTNVKNGPSADRETGNHKTRLFANKHSLTVGRIFFMIFFRFALFFRSDLLYHDPSRLLRDTLNNPSTPSFGPPVLCPSSVGANAETPRASVTSVHVASAAEHPEKSNDEFFFKRFSEVRF
jgi:hypothetical protein